jgi:hypothetical protein
MSQNFRSLDAMTRDPKRAAQVPPVRFDCIEAL